MGVVEKRVSSKGVASYRAKVRLRGFPPQNATFDRLTDARKWVQDTESSIREGRYFKTAQAKKHTVAEMIHRYRQDVLAHKKDSANQEHYLKWWEKDVGKYLLSDVTPDLIVKSRSKLVGMKTQYSRTIGNATANRYVTAFGHVFTVAMNEWGWLESNPVRKIKKFKEPRGRVRFLDNKELPRLLAACRTSKNKLLYSIVVVALSTGARKDEILCLRWKDVDFKRQQIVFHETKNDERRVIPLRGRALELVRELRVKWDKQPEDERCEFVFPSEKKCQPVEIKTAWENCLTKAEIEDFRFHDLRHCAAS